jgi:hypothetical protein
VRVVRPLTSAFIDIALHRRGPEDLPASEYLFGLALAAYAVVVIVLLGIVSASEADTAWVAAGLVLDLGVIYLLLMLFGRGNQFLQAATALVGTGVFLNLIAIPLHYWDEALAAPPTEMTSPRMLILVLFIWSLDVAGYIVAKALAKPYIVGVSIMVVYELASIQMRQALFPPAG